MNLERITVVGSGLMGHGIAMIFAAKGHAVKLVDNDESKLSSAKTRVLENLNTMLEHGIKFTDTPEIILERIQTSTDFLQLKKLNKKLEDENAKLKEIMLSEKQKVVQLGKGFEFL